MFLCLFSFFLGLFFLFSFLFFSCFFSLVLFLCFSEFSLLSWRSEVCCTRSWTSSSTTKHLHVHTSHFLENFANSWILLHHHDKHLWVLHAHVDRLHEGWILEVLSNLRVLHGLHQCFRSEWTLLACRETSSTNLLLITLCFLKHLFALCICWIDFDTFFVKLDCLIQLLLGLECHCFPLISLTPIWLNFNAKFCIGHCFIEITIILVGGCSIS